MGARAILLLVAAICFLIAARGPVAGVRFELIGAAFVALAWVV